MQIEPATIAGKENITNGSASEHKLAHSEVHLKFEASLQRVF
jgi:hypothetical protein